MDDPRIAQLNRVLAHIEQKWGNGAITTAAQPRPPLPHIRTGFPVLDAVIGGVPCGKTTELFGRPTSGMTTLAHRVLHHAQRSDRDVIYIDLDSTFDPDYAVQCGVDLARLFLVRPDSPTEALDIARDLLTSGSVGALALDLGSLLPDFQQLRRLTHVLSRSGCAVMLLVNPHDKLLETSPSVLRLLVERVGWLHRNEDVCGYRSAVTVLKGVGLGKRVEIDITTSGSVESAAD